MDLLAKGVSSFFHLVFDHTNVHKAIEEALGSRPTKEEIEAAVAEVLATDADYWRTHASFLQDQGAKSKMAAEVAAVFAEHYNDLKEGLAETRREASLQARADKIRASIDERVRNRQLAGASKLVVSGFLLILLVAFLVLLIFLLTRKNK